MEQVSQEFLAALAKDNNRILDKQPLQKGEYEISFVIDGILYEFSSDGVYWFWRYNKK